MFTPKQFFQPNGALQAELTFTADGQVTWPSLYQKEDGTIDSIAGPNEAGQVLLTKVPSQPQDFAYFGNTQKLQNMNGIAQFSVPNQYSKNQEGRWLCNYRQGVNGFTSDELTLAGSASQQQIRTRVLGGVGRFPNQMQA